MKIEQVVVKYLSTNRHLTIPSLGTFVVKSLDREQLPDGVLPLEQQLLFSEFLRDDDGVLRSLLMREGLNELEAAGAIDRFVFEVRHELEGEGREFIIEGIGRLRREIDSTILFEADRGITSSLAHGVAEINIEVGGAAEQSAPEVISPASEPVVATPIGDLYAPKEQSQGDQESQDQIFGGQQTPGTTPPIARCRYSFADLLWIAIPIIAGIVTLVAVSMGMLAQWRTGRLELPEGLENFLIDVLKITG